MKMVDELPKITVGRAIGGQQVRNGSSGGANNRAAYQARSKAEFISKLGAEYKTNEFEDSLFRGSSIARRFDLQLTNIRKERVK